MNHWRNAKTDTDWPKINNIHISSILPIMAIKNKRIASDIFSDKLQRPYKICLSFLDDIFDVCKAILEIKNTHKSWEEIDEGERKHHSVDISSLVMLELNCNLYFIVETIKKALTLIYLTSIE